MKRARVFATAVGLAILLGQTLTGFAQEPGLVIVDISGIARSVASNIGIDDSKIPLTVQVPTAVAANVCGLAANTLTERADSKPVPCKAQTTSAALDQHVRRQVIRNEQK